MPAAVSITLAAPADVAMADPISCAVYATHDGADGKGFSPPTPCLGPCLQVIQVVIEFLVGHWQSQSNESWPYFLIQHFLNFLPLTAGAGVISTNLLRR